MQVLYIQNFAQLSINFSDYYNWKIEIKYFDQFGCN